MTIRFGTDGWRAVLADEFTFTAARRVCSAIARHVRSELNGGLAGQVAFPGLLIAYDGRFLMDRFARDAAAAVMAEGVPARLARRDLPTPAVAHAVRALGAAGAIMFTASHNPPEYGGVKFIAHYGGPAPAEITKAVEIQLALGGEPGPPAPGPQPDPFDPGPAYLAHLETLLEPLDAGGAVTVIADPMYGSARGYLEEALRRRGLRVRAIHQHRDPLFGGLSPEPVAGQLAELARAVAQSPGSLGLATDGDGDRFGVVDEGGRYLSPNQVLPLLAAHLVEQRGMRGAVVRTVATTHLLDRVAAKYGLPVHETPVGFKHVAARMRAGPVVLGGEESGGLSIGGHIPEKDGILAGLLLAEVRAVAGRPLHEALTRLMNEVGPSASTRLDLPLPGRDGEGLLSRLRERPPDRVGSRRVLDLRTLDGVKFLLDDGSWVLARASGTEPLLRVYAEAPTPQDLEELCQAAATLVAP